MARALALCFAALVLFALPNLRAADETKPLDPQAVEFFEKKIRTVLIDQCQKCHSADAEKTNKLKGGLLLDSREGVLAGGDSGVAIVAGKPKLSRLIQSLKHDTDLKMPPKGKLSDAVIADFEKWVEMGAPDPRTRTATRKTMGMSVEDGRKLWAYRQPVMPTEPSVADKSWPFDPLDRFILSALEAKKRTPAADANREVLIRRIYFDLIGLPPTILEVDAFIADRSPKAYEAVVDRLLASPEFGERWGRHWLDVARFGESFTLRGLVMKEAWRYRDYVIESFNSDVPFDRFIREQIAGDLLPAMTTAERQRNAIATTYLTLGNSNLEEQDKKQLRMDVVDEQLDAITKGFLGQTVTCARCHDHKFDPIPTRDYYALAGILRNAKTLETANVSKWIEMPIAVTPAEEANLKQHDAAVAALQAQIHREKVKSPSAVATAKGAIPVKSVVGIVVDDASAKKVGEWQLSTHSGTYIGAGYLHDQDKDKGEKTLTFQPELPANGRYEVRLAYSEGTNRADAVPVTVFSGDGEKTIAVNMKKPPPIDGRFLSLGTYKFEKTGQSFVIVSNEGTKGHVTPDAVTFIPADVVEAKIPAKDGKPATTGNALAQLETQLKQLQNSGPKREMTMTVIEETAIEDAKVHVRGSVHTLGEVAPRGFLQVASYGEPPTIGKSQSGRKELADWIAAKSNPLTARVIVNRTWHWLLGSGIVRTVDNFGTTGEAPSHPELLDRLSLDFMAQGWSMKTLVRRIVLSHTYRQSSAKTDTDPENLSFGRANRRRLDAECIRDAMLQMSGTLDRKRGGVSFPASLAADYSYKNEDVRRSVYSPVFRNALPELLELFDFADPSTVTGRRNVSTVAPQSLFMLNHPFAIERSKEAAERFREAEGSTEQKIAIAYRTILGRRPTDSESRIADEYLKNHNDELKEAWAMFVQALFASAEFRYVK